MSQIDTTDVQNSADHPLQKAARSVHDILPDHGFIIITSPWLDDGKTLASADYVSNVRREDAVKILKTVLFRWGLNEEWMKEAK